MIVVIGSPFIAPGIGPGRAEGLGPSIARAAARAGAAVQLIGKVGDDADGDAALLALAQAGIGHVAVLRDAAHRTPRAPVTLDALAIEAAGAAGVAADASIDASIEVEIGTGAEVEARRSESLPFDASDLELALRYLVDYRVLVVAEPLDEASGRVVADAAAFASSAVIVVVRPGSPAPATLAGATVLEGPDEDEGPFAELVGRLAAGIDRGDPPGAALEAAIGGVGWEPVEP